MATIYGVSQSSGEERRLQVERRGKSLVLTIVRHAGDLELRRIKVGVDDLLAAVAGSWVSGSRAEGTHPLNGKVMQLGIETDRNEVLLTVRQGSDPAADIAVGTDDFRDALATAIKDRAEQSA